MRIAALERFADPSRRCEPALVRGPGDDLETFDLPDGRRTPVAFARALPGALRDWLRVPRTSVERRSLLRACLATGGARAGALLRAPGLLERLRRGDIDAIACHSTSGFALAGALARAAGLPCREALARGTRYFGEFAFELLAVVPYAYWLHRQGRLEQTASTADTRCLYYFSPRHVEHAGARRYVPITEYPIGRPGRWRYDASSFPAELDTSRWHPPPYKDVYRDERYTWSKPTCVVCNKATDEYYRWHRAPTNVLVVDLLLSVIGRLRERYQVVYVRPRRDDIVVDHQPTHEIGDHEAIARAYPDVLTIQRLRARHPELGYNELQLRLFAGCERFVSVLGGSAYLASWFGGVNVVYARRGWEVDCGAYERWFDRFSGARVVAAATPQALLSTIDRELV